MDFQKLLLEAGNGLSRDEVKALAFLCTDLLRRNMNSVDSASELFSHLADQDYLSSQRPHLLTELLCTIRRNQLARIFTLNNQQCATTGLISPYRKLLYELSEEITDEDLKQMKFLLGKTLPRRKLEENVTTLEVFLEMEHMDCLSERNLVDLETVIKSVCPMLMEKINQFITLQGQTNPIAQETWPPISGSFQPNQSSDDQIQATRTALQPSPKSVAERNNAVGISLQESEDLESYSMMGGKRGFCLIINNYDFTAAEPLRNRDGTEIDEEFLRDVFVWLGFHVDVKRDCTRDQMQDALLALRNRDHSQVDCMVCCILSHGQEDSVFGVDGKTVMLAELRQHFNGTTCPSLANKPKLFFIQACQGTNKQHPVYIQCDGHTDSSISVDSGVVSLKTSIPNDADYLFAMSTLPSFVSFRDKKNGSWFIQSLCQNLIQMVPRGWDLMSILTKVNADVNQKTTGVYKQMPQPQFTLRKKVVFPPPNTVPPVRHLRDHLASSTSQKNKNHN